MFAKFHQIVDIAIVLTLWQTFSHKP